MAKNLSLIKIDGSCGEGGGAILRVASALAVIKKQAIEVFNIRKGRKEPGLKPQHLLGIQNLAKLSNGYLEGDKIGSQEIRFYPKEIVSKDLFIKIETAGSITLCLQSLLPAALFAPNSIKIVFDGGGTDVPFSPTIDYYRYVFLKILKKMLPPNDSQKNPEREKIEINVLKRGYYPEGGAKVEIKISPVKFFKSLNLIKRGHLKKIIAISGAANFLKTKKVAERQIAGSKEILGKLKLPIEEKIEYYETKCPGSQFCLIAEFENTVIGTDNLGRLGKRAEEVGKEAALELLKEEKTGACLDKHLADQILLFMALSKEKSQVTVSEITTHTKTNIWIIEKFLNGRFEIQKNLITWLPS